MKVITLISIALSLFSASTLSQAPYQRKAVSTIRNPTIAGSAYSFEIWVKNDSLATTFFVGNSDFYFTYNATALSSPTLSNINPKYTGNTGVDNYEPMQVTIVGGRIQVGVRYTGAMGGSSLLSTSAPYGELVCQVNLNIVNAAQTAQLAWDGVNSGVLTTGSFAVSQNLQGTDNSPLPVQLVSFSGSVLNSQGHVRLNWRTLSETNNYGFYVQKSQNGQNSFQTVSQLIPGFGTTLEPHDYLWIDVNTIAGVWYYRLKQVDLSGSEHFSEAIVPSVLVGVEERPLPTEFGLSQNYPNPFNPSTRIEFALPRQSHVQVALYNLLGQKVAILADDVRPAGYHSVEFNAKGFPTGLYFYRMTFEGNRTLMKKMTLLK